MKKEIPEECKPCSLGFTYRTCIYKESDRPCSKVLKNTSGSYINTSYRRLEHVIHKLKGTHK